MRRRTATTQADAPTQAGWSRHPPPKPPGSSSGFRGAARDWFFGVALCTLAAAAPLSPVIHAEDIDVYLTLEEAPKAVFPEADAFERKDIQVDDALHQGMKDLIGRAKPTIWEPFYISFIAKKNEAVIGYAVVCEEIGKHRPMTFIVAVHPDGRVKDVALMMYREAVGAEVRYPSFLKQFQQKNLDSPILPRRDIKNISGATLSVRAMSRGVRKALAFLQLAYLEGGAKRSSAP